MDKREHVFNILCPDWILTAKCNLRCKYCFEHEHPNKDMDDDLLFEWLSYNPMTSAFPFGGEPLLVIDKYNKVLDMIKENPRISKSRKDATLKKMKTVITNGILIPKVVDKIKKHGLHMQISIDGVKECHDKNRIYVNGKGSFDDVMKGIMCCIENDINWSLHGAMNKDTLPFFFETSKFFFNMYAKYKSIDYAVRHLKNNTFQVIFEQEWDDNDVDMLINQFYKLADWIWNHEDLSDKQKKILFDNFFFKTGGVCAAGSGLLSLDNKLNIYPCHRLMFGDYFKDKYELGNVFKPEEFDLHKIQMYNALIILTLRKRYMYSSVTQIDNYKNYNMLSWFNWCPATNLEECKSPFFQPVKYNLMFTEVNRAIKTLRLMYFGELTPDHQIKRD